MSFDASSRGAEWRAHWPLVLACFLGVAFPSVAYYSMGLFIEPLTAEFGWTRTQISAGASISSLIIVPLAPIIGAMVDRFGVRWLALPGIVFTALSIASFSFANGDPTQWMLLWVVFAFCQAFLKTTIWTAAVSYQFTAARSLALAVVLCGISFASALTPPLAQWLIAAFGWRAAYVALAFGWSAPALVLCVFFLRNRKSGSPQPSAQPGETVSRDLRGLTLRQAFTNLVIIRIAFATLITLLLTAGLVVHQVPLLVEAGLDRSSAAYLASLAGIAAIAGSLISGWLMDRFHAGLVGAATNVAAALALVLLLEPIRTPTLIVIAMLVIGYTTGTKLQLCGYLTGIYGGLRNYGKIFGIMASIIAVTSAIGPMFGGLIFDRTGSYNLFIIVSIPASLMSALLLTGLGPYPNWNTDQDTGEDPAKDSAQRPAGSVSAAAPSRS